MSDIIKKEEIKLDPQGYVTLPFNEQDFKDFVVGLLGNPQTIDHRIEGPFIIDQVDIKNIYSLLNQRITQQNDATLIQFNATVVFSDNSSILLNSVEELLSFNEIKPVISTELHLRFQYLIKFIDKKVPEKQEINLSFYISEEDSETESRSVDTIFPFSLVKTLFNHWQNGFIQYTIKHTARTWGTDIDNLLSNHISNLIQKETGFRQSLRKNLKYLVLIFFFCIVSFGLYTGNNIQNQLNSKNLKLIENAFKYKGKDLNTLSDEIKFVANHSLADTSGAILLSFLIATVLAGFIVMISVEIIAKKRDSFILLTKQSHIDKTIKDKKYERSWTRFFISLVVSILCSIIANFLTPFFVK